VTGRGCPSSSRRNENKKNTTERVVPSLSCPNEKDVMGRGIAPPHHVKMRAMTRGEGGMPYLIALKCEMERTRGGGGMRPPPCRVKKET